VILRIDPTRAANFASQIRNAAYNSAPGEHIRVEISGDGRTASVGLSNGHVVRDERYVSVSR
jgi:hypothetical protein